MPQTENQQKIQLIFRKEAMRDLDWLKAIFRAASRVQVVKDALGWLFWCTKEVLAGGKIIIERDGVQREVVFPFFKAANPGSGELQPPTGG